MKNASFPLPEDRCRAENWIFGLLGMATLMALLGFYSSLIEVASQGERIARGLQQLPWGSTSAVANSHPTNATPADLQKGPAPLETSPYPAGHPEANNQHS